MNETQPIKNDNTRLAKAIFGDSVAGKTQYTLADCGCYVDSARGIYAIDKIVAFAEAHGAKIEDCTDDHTHEDTCDESRFAGCEFAGEIEDECDEYMNEHFAVDGATWGRSEQGDWGLWEIEPEENDEPNEPEEGDITTEDHRKFYQYGKLWLDMDEEDAAFDGISDMNAAVKAENERREFLPECLVYLGSRKRASVEFGINFHA